jgi:transcriptional antiterminator NusG
MSELSDKKWYVVRAAGGKEKKAKEYIENEIKRLGLTDYVSQVLIPTEKIYQVKNGKKVSVERHCTASYEKYGRVLCLDCIRDYEADNA